MKKILLFLCTCAFVSCFKMTEDCTKKKPLDKITVTGKVVYDNGNLVENCDVCVNRSKWFAYDYCLTTTTTNKAGEFVLDFSPYQDEKFWCDNYVVKCAAPTGFYQEATSKYTVDKYKRKQNFKVVLKKEAQ